VGTGTHPCLGSRSLAVLFGVGCLRKWGTGGFRRPSPDKPFGDVIASSPTHKLERQLAPHPSLKPQQFLRTLVRGVLPLGRGIVLDPFCGTGSTLAAAEAVDTQVLE
jgi:DNA modification methylase